MKAKLVCIISAVALVVGIAGSPLIEQSPVNATTILNAGNSPTGRIAYVSKLNGQEDLYVMNADGSDKHRLTYLGNVHQPAWSPDGTRIVFASFSSYLASDGEIYVVNADGSGLTRLTNNSAFDWHPTWSPDGSRIAFASYRDGNGEIYVMNANGSGQTRLTNNSVRDDEPAWSPGTRIAFFRVNGSYNWDIYTMNADGSGLTQLTSNATVNIHQDWSPDGQRIAFVSYRAGGVQIFVMNADGSSVTRLTNCSNYCWHPSWSSDGQHIAFVTQGDIYVMNADGTGITNVTNNAAEDEDPDWSPSPTPPTTCQVPFFSQVDENWKDHPLRTDPSNKYKCSAYCSTIGHCGCTLTSAAMVFNTYGANTSPPQLSDCMGTSACPYGWFRGAKDCSEGKASFVDRPEYRNSFDWSRLDREINQYHRPVVLGMCKKGTCNTDKEQTHWVVVISGQGNNPSSYRVHDPAFKCTANILLSTLTAEWEFVWIGIYDGNAPCNSLTALIPPCVSHGANPQPVQFTPSANVLNDSPLAISASSVLSGTVWIYTRTELTMTLEVTAASSVGNITQMIIWSDTISNTNWQAFTPFVWLPASDIVYVRFHDDMGNMTDIYSDTLNIVGPPTAPIYDIFLPVVVRNQ